MAGCNKALLVGRTVRAQLTRTEMIAGVNCDLGCVEKRTVQSQVAEKSAIDVVSLVDVELRLRENAECAVAEASLAENGNDAERKQKC
jgi:hypothetical protein